MKHSSIVSVGLYNTDIRLLYHIIYVNEEMPVGSHLLYLQTVSSDSCFVANGYLDVMFHSVKRFFNHIFEALQYTSNVLLRLVSCIAMQ